MSTFFVSLGVMVLAIGCATWVALRSADQTATGPGRSRRDHRRESPPPVGRGRAGLALSVLVAFVGVMVALVVAAGAVFVTQSLRNAAR